MKKTIQFKTPFLMINLYMLTEIVRTTTQYDSDTFISGVNTNSILHLLNAHAKEEFTEVEIEGEESIVTEVEKIIKKFDEEKK